MVTAATRSTLYLDGACADCTKRCAFNCKRLGENAKKQEKYGCNSSQRKASDDPQP